VATEENTNWAEDPGWRLNWRVMVRMVPQLQVAYMRRARTDGLINLRSIWATFALGLLLIGDPLRFLLAFEDGWPSVFATAGLCALSVALFYGVPRIERPLTRASDRGLAEAFETRMFLRIAFAMSPALFGFTAAFVVNASWVFYVSALASVPALLRAAPSRRALARDQEELTARRCDRSLVAVLRRPRQG
jgi:hypothetical protein